MEFGSAEGIIIENNLTLNANISGTGGLTLSGPGLLTLPNPNTYSGTTYLDAGTLALGSQAALPSAGTLVLAGGTIEATNSLTILNPTSMNNASITIAGNNPIMFTSVGTLEGNNTITLTNTGGTTFAGGFAEALPGASLSLAGSATVDLPTSGSYSGGTTIGGPTVLAGSNSAFGTGILNLQSGSIIAGAPAVIGQPLASGGNMLSNPVLFSGGVFTFDGSAPLLFTGPATLTNTEASDGQQHDDLQRCHRRARRRPSAGDGTQLGYPRPRQRQHLLGRHNTRGRRWGRAAPCSSPEARPRCPACSSPAPLEPARSPSAVVCSKPVPPLTLDNPLIIGGSNALSASVTFAGSPMTFTGPVAVTGTALAVAPISSAGKITAFIVASGGTGYTSAPTVTLVGGGGSGGKGTAVLTNGAVSSITLTAGSGYTSAPIVTIAGPTGAATSTLNVNNSTTFAGAVTSTVALTEEGTGTLLLTTANPSLTGLITVNSGTLSLSGNGTVGTTNLVVNQGGTLTLDNTGANLSESDGSTGRLSSTAGLTLNGGTFNFLGNAAAPSSEDLGSLILSGGNSTINSVNGAAGATLTFSGLSRGKNGGTIDFVATARQFGNRLGHQPASYQPIARRDCRRERLDQRR